MLPTILTLAEVSRRTGVPEETLRFYRKQRARGESRYLGPVSFKLGRRVVYYESDVQAWMDAERQKALAGPDAGDVA